jgi:hypothetical protein
MHSKAPANYFLLLSDDEVCAFPCRPTNSSHRWALPSSLACAFRAAPPGRTVGAGSVYPSGRRTRLLDGRHSKQRGQRMKAFMKDITEDLAIHLSTRVTAAEQSVHCSLVPSSHLVTQLHSSLQLSNYNFAEAPRPKWHGTQTKILLRTDINAGWQLLSRWIRLCLNLQRVTVC